MKNSPLTITLQNSPYLIQNIFLFFFVTFLAVVSPFWSWQGLRYDLFGSLIFFIFFNRYRCSLLLLVFLSFYIDSVTATPFGSTGTFVLLIWCFSQIAQVLLKKRTFLIHWVAFGVVYLSTTVFKLLMMNLLLRSSCHPLTELYSFVLTVCCYPMMCSFLIQVFSYFNFKSR